MNEGHGIDFSQPISLFPLEQCVLLPHTTIPLHIFETRYRLMTADALSGDRLIAMAVLDPSMGQANSLLPTSTQPEIRPVVCVGSIVEYQQLPDGRYHLLLQGKTRARVVEEFEPTEYRTAILEPIESEQSMEIDLQEQRVKLDVLLDDSSLKKLATIGQVKDWIKEDLPTAALVDALSLVLLSESELRYAMLEEADASERARKMIQILESTREVMLRAQPMFGHARDEDGFFLN